MKILKTIVIRIFAVMGLFIDKSTDRDKVISLIKKLHPFSTGKDLIRIGGDQDGGYLIPDDLENIEACFSPGVGPTSWFEKHCLEYGMKVFMADNSVDGPAIENNEFNFVKKFIGSTNNENFMTLDYWVDSNIESKDSDLLLQMDIEGYEFLTIANLSDELLKRFRIIIIEFHDLDKLWHKTYYHLAEETFGKLLQNHTCAHIHPNNYLNIDKRKGVEIPIVAEFTFIRNDRVIEKTSQKVFPHPLDFDNSANDTPVSLPKQWYS
ncbi:FkbM family methyltransferase [Aquimarina macrocephali]|uniref:FkbM family methyltransferase n=1 Tax=Aquimarina macrocephali TaxID=666563 RepID=UPI0004AF9459|nr:FkbM family methyltransferase [Aquimarina macrocephali]